MYPCAGETGMEYEVKVFCDEGLATHIGPEPCGAVREDSIEASVGGHIGQPSSHEMGFNPDADALDTAEGNTVGSAIASARAVRRGLRPWHVCTLHVREPGGLQIGRRRQRPLARDGKARSRSRQ